MNPVIFNCVTLYLTVVLISVLQSRFRIVKDNPVVFFLLLFLGPLLILGKAKRLKTWTSLTGFEIWGWTLILAYFNPKRIIPKVNEAYIYAYTLFHWYLLIDSIKLKGFNYWLILVAVISVIPTFLIVKAAVQHKRLAYSEKLVRYYWFLFVISFTYIDQVALDIFTPILTLTEINFANSAYVFMTAIQLYFIATSFSLLFVGIPLFHLERGSAPFSERWESAMSDWREVVSHKLGNFVEYQINLSQLLIITAVSAGMFYLDFIYNFRLYLILIYTVLFPLVFFYLKWSPEENIENDNVH